MRIMNKARRIAAVTLLEIMVAIAVLGTGSSACVATLLNMNHNATLSRLRTGAGTVAQNQIDYFLSIQPYNPQKNQIPPQLAVGTRYIGSSAAPTVAIYTDPRTGLVNCWGWIVSDVADMEQSLGTA